MHYAREHTAVLLLMAITLTGLACDDEKSPPTPPPAPPTAPPTPQAVAPTPATQPANPEPAQFVIDNQAFTFPPAKLVLEKADGKLHAMLFSIDPPNAVKQNDVGNSFYFNLDLEIASLDDLPGQRVEYRNSSGATNVETDRDDDATTGIFIAGGKQVLQPLQAAVEFRVTETNEIVVLVGGTFKLRDDRTQDAAPVQVDVRARLQPVVKEQTR